MAYLSDIELQTVNWFRELEHDAKPRCDAIKLDPLGYLTLILKPEANDEDKAWLAYIAAQAKGKLAHVNFDECGVLVLILPRYVRAKQEEMELPNA